MAPSECGGLTPPSRRCQGTALHKALRAQQLTEGFRRAIECVIKLFRVFAAGLGEVSLPAPLPTHNRSELLNQRVGRNPVDEILGAGGQQCNFSVRGAAED